MNSAKTWLKQTLWMAMGMGLGGAIAAACSGTVSATIEGPGTGEGALTLDWTVGGATTSQACASIGADAIEVVVTDQSGGQVADVTGSCDDFTITIDLPAGTYAAETRLLTVDSEPVTTALPLGPVGVVTGSEAVMNVNFPLASVL